MAKSNRSSVYFDRTLQCFVGLDAGLIQDLKALYPGIHVDAEFIKMRDWLIGSKGKKTKGTIGFIINWLNRLVPAAKFPSAEKQLEYLQSDTFLCKVIKEYLEDLWKDKEHLLSFNSREGK